MNIYIWKSKFCDSNKDENVHRFALSGEFLGYLLSIVKIRIEIEIERERDREREIRRKRER